MQNTTPKEKLPSRKVMFAMLLAIPAVFLAVGLIHAIAFGNAADVITGLKNITLSPTILLTDFIKVGGVSAAFVNAAVLGFFNFLLASRFRLEVNGSLIAAFFTVMGFSLFGKNLFNVIPIYAGGYLYSRYRRIPFGDVMIILMFSTALSPIVSEISFAGFLPVPAGITVGQVFGLFIGFVIVPLSEHMLKFHGGFNLYNIGFTAGVLGMILTALLRSFGVTVEPVEILHDENSASVLLLPIVMFLGFAAAGLIINRNAATDYIKLFAHKSASPNDYTGLVGYGVTFFNVALLGFLGVAYVLLVGGVLNGPVLAGIFTMAGFGALGKHIKNCIPVVFGTVITALVLGYDLSATAIIISVLFSTTLAPIAGFYGAGAGIAAGFLHMILVTNVGVVHGGINLYNNGFSGGIVAGVLVPLIRAFKRDGGKRD